MTYDYNEWLKNPIKIFCKCKCGGEIIIQNHHKYYGIPEYIYGHNNIGKKQSEEHIKKRIGDQTGDKNPVNKPGVKEKISNTLKGRFCGENNPNWKPKIIKICPSCSKEFKIKPYLSELKKYCSNECVGIANRGENNPMFNILPKHFSYGCYYESPLQGKVYLRSSYELKYAKYLDSKNILWMYEMETFDLGGTTYTPDFFLPKTEEFIEIKGFMREMAQEKIDMFLEQYPWDLKILYKEDLIKLGCEL